MSAGETSISLAYFGGFVSGVGAAQSSFIAFIGLALALGGLFYWKRFGASND